MRVARKAGRADPGAAHRGRRHSSAARRGQALAAGLTEALAALDAVASEPFPVVRPDAISLADGG
jgi:hypothetical protein